MSLFAIDNGITNGINKLDLKSKDVIEKYLKSANGLALPFEINFNYLYCFNGICNMYCHMYDNIITIFSINKRGRKSVTIWGYPLTLDGSSIDKEKFKEIVDSILYNTGIKKVYYKYTTERFELPNESEEYLDFIYDVNEWDTLSGSKFSYHRNIIKRLFKEHNIKVSEFKLNEIDELYNFRESWKPNSSEEVWDNDFFEFMVSEYDKLEGVKFNVIKSDDKILGYVVVSKSSNDVGCIMTINANRDIKGLSEYCIKLSCDSLRELGMKYANIGMGGDDNNGLTKFKLKMRPCHSNRRYYY